MVNGFSGKHQVALSIQNYIDQDGTTENFELAVVGQIYYLGKACFIEYSVPENENEFDDVKVRIKISEGNQILINRKNSNYHLHMPLILGKETLAYSKVAGLLPIEMMAQLQKIEINQQTNLTGSLAVSYKLFTGEEMVGMYQLKLQYSPLIV